MSNASGFGSPIPERELARCRGFDFSIEDGRPHLCGVFEYGEDAGGGQGFGYFVDEAFLAQFLRAVGAERLRDVEGRSCWVTHTHNAIQRVEPLFRKDGTPFDVERWSRWCKERKADISIHETFTCERAPRPPR